MFPSSAIQRPDLGLALEEFDLEMANQGFIAQKVLPVIDVQLATANFSRVKLENLLFSADVKRAPGAGYGRGKGEFTQDNYATQEYGYEEPNDDNERKIYAYTIDSEMLSAKRARHVLLSEYEKRVVAKVYDTAVWTGSALTTAVGTAWSVPATATPINDVQGASKKVYQNFGIVPDTMTLTWLDYQNLRLCSQIIDRIKYSGRDDPKNVTPQMLAAVFDLKEVLVAGAVFNSANEGQAATLSPVWTAGYSMVFKAATDNDLRKPCMGRTFHWTADGSSIGGTIEQYRDEKVRSDVFRARHQTGEKILNKEVGHLLTGL
jgi:hypothetical protein